MRAQCVVRRARILQRSHRASSNVFQITFTGANEHRNGLSVRYPLVKQKRNSMFAAPPIPIRGQLGLSEALPV